MDEFSNFEPELESWGDNVVKVNYQPVEDIIDKDGAEPEIFLDGDHDFDRIDAFDEDDDESDDDDEEDKDSKDSKKDDKDDDDEDDEKDKHEHHHDHGEHEFGHDHHEFDHHEFCPNHHHGEFEHHPHCCRHYDIIEKPDMPMGASVCHTLDAVDRDPSLVAITKIGSNYYIKNRDLRCYMDACGKCRYESALNDIINANDDPGLYLESIRVTVTPDEMEYMDSDLKAEMESSDIRFEIR